LVFGRDHGPVGIQDESCVLDGFPHRFTCRPRDGEIQTEEHVVVLESL
jgi:hypothetical protein